MIRWKVYFSTCQIKAEMIVYREEICIWRLC